MLNDTTIERPAEGLEHEMALHDWSRWLHAGPRALLDAFEEGCKPPP